jgi:hypothetical protein
MRVIKATMGGAFLLSLAGCGPKVEAPPPERPSIDSIFPAGWQYEAKTDEMSGKVDYTACIMSENSIFLMPSGEKARGRLCLRDNSIHGKDVMISIPAGGHIECISGCTMRVRFNEDPPLTLDGVQPSGFSNMAIFATAKARARVREGVAGSAKTRIEVGLHGAGHEVFTFNTSGLDLSKIQRAS